MTIGANAAEMDEEFLLKCFVRYPAVEMCTNVASRGMVLDGRTGSGKTAILKYVHSNAEHSIEIDPSEMAMSYVSNSDALNFLHAIGADLDLLFQALWKHVLCIEFIRLKFSVTNEMNCRRNGEGDRQHPLSRWGGRREAQKRQSIHVLTLGRCSAPCCAIHRRCASPHPPYALGSISPSSGKPPVTIR
jgi:hypothetical protein